MTSIAKQKGTKVPEKKCKYCTKKAHKFSDPKGNASRRNDFMEPTRKGHPWELKGKIVKVNWNNERWGGSNTDKLTSDWKYDWSTIQPHHLIPCTVMKTKTGKNRNPTDTKIGLYNPSFGDICEEFGYEINNSNNGVWLPSFTELACHFGVPLHNGGHTKEYYKTATKLVKPVIDKVLAGKQCENYSGFQKDLDTVSEELFDLVMSFGTPLTKDYKHYQRMPGIKYIGCGNVEGQGDKPKTPIPCIHNGKHFISLPKHTPSIGN